jgi:hypothetical protein
MPGLFTHYLCGDKLQRTTDNHTVKELACKYRQVFNLGTQGPDIFFYYPIRPRLKNKGLGRIGSRLHSENVEAFFSRALKYIREEAQDGRDVLTAYLFGFLCHYATDSGTHPFVYYRTGFAGRDKKSVIKYYSFHCTFETIIDVLMLKRELGICPYDVKAHKLIGISRKDARTIGRMYEVVLRDVYGVNAVRRDVVRTILNMRRLYAFLRDKYGLKRALLSLVNRLTGYTKVISGLIHPARIEGEKDYLNLENSFWALPWDITAENTRSFCEMFDSSVQEAGELCKTALLHLNGSLSIDKALERIGNRSFSTGMDCDKELEFIYYDCIFE